MKTNLGLILLGLSPLLSIAQNIAPKPYGVIPSERQLKWHEMETYCLIHYTPTTFQDKEWGYGDADAKIFNPSQFDANQIAQAAASAGFKGLISVAKHHDGFCLWPTATTTYSVASSPWKNGKGDMVKDFMEASHANGMEFGVYLSAWDRNDTRYGTSDYTDAYREQLKELMSNYGTLFASWHDGANGGDGYYGGKNEKRVIDQTTYYEWFEKTWPIVRQLQPMASIFSDIGPDMRWVGNEHGFAAETSWATITPIGHNGKQAMPGATDAKNLPTGDRNGELWIPAECDVPQRPGWFYHKNQDAKVKTPNQLFEIYMKSVGRGANMNLGLAPMPEGYLHPNDVKSLEYFGKKVKYTFANNMANGATAVASSKRSNSSEFDVANVFDADRYSYYAPADAILNPSIEIKLKGEKEFDIIRLRENIKLGQRLDSVQVEVYNDGKWTKLASATSIGANRLIKLEKPVKAQRLRVNLFAPVVPTLSDFGLFKEFDEPFSFDDDKTNYTKLKKKDYSFSPVVNAAVDGDINTFVVLPDNSKEMSFQLNRPIQALSYLPRQDGNMEGTILKYEILTSDNGKDWSTIQIGEFANIKANPIEQTVDFSQPVKAKFIKLVATEVIGKNVTVAEIGLYNK